MHEIGVVMQVLETVENFAKKHQVTKVDTLVLQIGELSSMIPKYIEAVYPAAVDSSILENSKLEIEILPANGICHSCKRVSPMIKNNGMCPTCITTNMELISGKEFMIKEIRCY